MFKSKVVYQGLLNDIKMFKKYSENSTKLNIFSQRVSFNYKIIEGTFIFKKSPTNIYNRFARKFGRKLKWFKFTPKNVIQLSNYRADIENDEITPKLKMA